MSISSKTAGPVIVVAVEFCVMPVKFIGIFVSAAPLIVRDLSTGVGVVNAPRASNFANDVPREVHFAALQDAALLLK